MSVHLFLSPHLDDAVLSCGGTMHRLAQSGERVIIVTAMAGEPTEPLPASPVVDSIRLRWSGGEYPFQERRAEDVQAATRLGAQVYHLPLVEAAFRGTTCGAGDWIAVYPDFDSPFQGIDDADDARLTLFETPLPFAGVSAIYAPFCVDPHVDHRLVRDWALVLTGAQGSPVLYLYEEFPQARQKAAQHQARAFYHQHDPALTLAREVVTLSEADCTAKLSAMGCYRSHLHVLWNDPAEMEQLTRDYMQTVGDGTPAECTWRVVR